jgi:hypothetical protein
MTVTLSRLLMGSMAWSARELATEQRRSMISSEGTGRRKERRRIWHQWEKARKEEDKKWIDYRKKECGEKIGQEKRTQRCHGRDWDSDNCIPPQVSRLFTHLGKALSSPARNVLQTVQL